MEKDWQIVLNVLGYSPFSFNKSTAKNVKSFCADTERLVEALRKRSKPRSSYREAEIAISLKFDALNHVMETVRQFSDFSFLDASPYNRFS